MSHPIDRITGGRRFLVKACLVLFALALPFLLFYPTIEADMGDEMGDAAAVTPGATLASAAGPLDAAVPWLLRAEAFSPSMGLEETVEPADDPARQALARAHLAEAHLVLGDMERAEIYSAEAVGIDPGGAQAWSVRGDVLLALHEMDEAEAALEKATSLDPTDFVSRGRLAYLWILRHDFARARSLLEEAVGIAEESGLTPTPDVFHNLGIAYQMEGQPEKARDAYAKAAAYH